MTTHRSKPGQRPEGASVLFNPSGVPAIVPIIPFKGWWTSNNNVGNEVPFKASSDNRLSVLTMPEWGPPEVWTVCLYLVDELEAYDGFGITAELQFGVGGSTQIMRVDWVNGMQISLPMNALNVIATFQDLDVTTEGPGIRLGAQVARGTRAPNTMGPRLTILERVSLLGGTNTGVLPLPRFASRVYAYSSTIVPANRTVWNSNLITLYTAASKGVATTPIAVADGSEPNGLVVPVTGQAHSTTLDNQSGTDFLVTVVAELTG